jgi:hypothetical protein
MEKFSFATVSITSLVKRRRESRNEQKAKYDVNVR